MMMMMIRLKELFFQILVSGWTNQEKVRGGRDDLVWRHIKLNDL